MDINTMRAIATVLLFIAFIAICVWAYSGKRKQRFDEAAQLPFADEEPGEKKAGQSQSDSSNEER